MVTEARIFLSSSTRAIMAILSGAWFSAAIQYKASPVKAKPPPKMNQVRLYEPHRFESAAPFYERYRLDYPERLIALAGLRPGDPVLDLGTGPGLLAVPFARAGMTVTAADPEPAMLEAAGAAAEAAGVKLTLWQGSAYELTPEMGPFRLVAIGRAFHWMDRDATLKMLDRIVAPDGGVGFFHDAHPDVA